MQQGCGVDEFHGGGQMHVIGPVIATQPRGGQGQHRAQAFAAGPHKMRGDFGNAGGVLRGHAFLDQAVHRRQFLLQQSGQCFVRFCGGVIKTHGQVPVTGVDSGPSLILHPQYERAFAQ